MSTGMGKREARVGKYSSQIYCPANFLCLLFLLLQRDVKKGLLKKAAEYSQYPNLENEFLTQAESYSLWDAAIDFYYYGKNQAPKVVIAIENGVKSSRGIQK